MSDLYLKTRSINQNICKQFFNAQNTGRRIKHHGVPSALNKSERYGVEDYLRKSHTGVWDLIETLDKLYFLKKFDTLPVLESLEKLHKLFTEDDANFHMVTNAKTARNMTVPDIFYMNGGTKVILRVLFHPVVNGKADTLSISNEAQRKIRVYCFEILRSVCLAVENVALMVGKFDHLIEFLFSCMEDRKTFLAASTLLEELLASNRKIVDLSQIKNLQSLTVNLRESNFPGFCRILSTAVADIDFSEQRCTLLAQDKEEHDRSHEKSLADLNQGLLLSYPEFLSRMVKLASKPFPGGSLISQIPPALQSLVLNVPIPMENIHEILDGDDPPPISSLFSLNNQSNASSHPSSSNNSQTFEHPTWLPLPVQVMNEVMHKVEILYVLTLFLCGKYKYDVQAKLSDLKFIPMLCDMFDKLYWNTESNRFPRHNHHEDEDCDCTPESALKIQFLRFVHSFCDHNDKRYLLLCSREIQEMRDLCDKYGTQRPVSLDKSRSKYRCSGQKGLITKIIDVLKKTAANNALRFWLSRAIEGFLRGSVSPPDQHFLINRGLIKHLYEHIVTSDTKAKEIIQSSFDLLGELMKFNVAGFVQFNQSVESGAQFEKFLSVMTSSVVDSNMFIRCIVLSHERFSSTGVYNTQQCHLSGIIKKWEHKIYLMYKLITSISVDSLTQENVSCLNTTLIFLMFAYNHGQLDKYLQAFLTEEEAQKHPGLILSNLRELLLFWKTHYLNREKDCAQLQQSSSITFEKWQSVVDVMLSEDISKQTSILCYLTPKHTNSIHFRTVDYLSRDA
ncbi:short transient receptor potential channel 4-associated protein-like [Hydractinia symbiolongicarpus]|uniref:short transient receptor potential channel 4-associated protein-like n=1 Tax=Hydractinia symbiolongicarpus TaxID=13093 RepID=UPI00254AB6E8|nr:short transient receptor potential channel 4-associated protein-like [Hydractinia symbiolongicarpus]